MKFFNFNPSNVNSLECVSMNNQECRTRTKIININNNEPVFYPFSIKVNRCSGSCNNINDPYAKLCVLNVVKNKVFKVLCCQIIQFDVMEQSDKAHSMA